MPAGLPVTDEVLAIPLGPRRLVGTALDLLTRSDAGLRSASFYIGFLMLATVGPMVALLGLALVTSRGEDPFFGGYGEAPAWTAWLFLAMIPGLLGFVGAGVEARTLATAVIGGRAEGRPLRLRESIAIARRRFWSILGVQVLLGLVTVVASLVVGLVLGIIVGPTDALDYGLSVILGVAIGAPFVYAPSGIVLGEATATVALGRSIRLAIARKRLAIVVTLFSVLSQLILQLGLGTALDTVSRLLAGTGMLDAFPRGPGGAGRRGARVRLRDAGLPRRGDRGGAGGPRVRGADALHGRARARAARAPARAPLVGPVDDARAWRRWRPSRSSPWSVGCSRCRCDGCPPAGQAGPRLGPRGCDPGGRGARGARRGGGSRGAAARTRASRGAPERGSVDPELARGGPRPRSPGDGRARGAA